MVMDAVPEVVDSADTWAVWDGHRSSGQWAFTLATRKAIEQAADHGIAIGMVHNYNVAGSFGAYIQMAIDAGMVAMANTSLPLVSPWGGMENVLSGAPFAAVIPRGDLPPVISDVSMIDAHDGDISEAYYQGKPLRRCKVLVDPVTGELTHDPRPTSNRWMTAAGSPTAPRQPSSTNHEPTPSACSPKCCRASSSPDLPSLPTSRGPLLYGSSPRACR
jgi:LDH2 family malate/lactate/ureidoglycolate dehydrogenase